MKQTLSFIFRYNNAYGGNSIINDTYTFALTYIRYSSILLLISEYYFRVQNGEIILFHSIGIAKLLSSTTVRISNENVYINWN